MKNKITHLGLLIFAALQFCLTHPKQSLTIIGLSAAEMCKAQFSATYRPTDSSCVYPGSWSGVNIYTVRDSLNSLGSNFTFSCTSVYLPRLVNKNAGTPTNQLWVSPTGSLCASPIVAPKRTLPLTATTNSLGIASFTFSAFTTTPNIQYNPGFGFGNKETCIPNASPTTTSCSFYVQLRSDVIGLLPTYSNVSGREVNILVTEK